MSSDASLVPECKICYMDYDSTNRRPVNGTCGHTLCQKCREQLPTSKCPMCQKDEAFIPCVVNFDLLTVIDNLKKATITGPNVPKKQQQPFPCSRCNDETPKLWICATCNSDLLSEDGTAAVVPTTVEEWSMKAHKVSTCSDCVIYAHHGHKVSPLIEFSKQFESNSFIAKSEKNLSELNKLNDVICEGLIKDLKQLKERQIDIIQSSMKISGQNEIFKADKQMESLTAFLRDVYKNGDELRDRVQKVSKCFLEETESMRNTGKVEVSKLTLELAGSNEPFLMADRKQNLKQALTIGKFHPKTKTFTVVGKITNQRSNYASVTVQNQVFLIGGMVGGTWLDTVEMYDSGCHRKTELPKMIHGRTRTAAAYHKGKIYVCGGYDGSYLNSVEAYDVDKKSWYEIPNMVKKRADSAVISVQGRLYVLGGYNGKDYEEAIEVYNEESKQFEVVGEMNGSRAGFGICVFRDRIYIAGGWSNSSNTLKTVKSYDYVNEKWREEPSMTKPRKYVTMHASCDGVFAVRGCADNWSLIPDTEQLDMKERQWVCCENLSARSNEAA